MAPRIRSVVVFCMILPSMMWGIVSCMPGREVAKTFINSPQGISLLITPPTGVLKYNHKGEEIGGFDSMNAGEQDSALWFSSRYMQFVDDSILLENYMNSFLDELNLLGFRVRIGDTVDQEAAATPQSYKLAIPQVQLDEYLYPVRDEDAFLDTVYYKTFELNAVDFSCWFELSKASAVALHKTVLYSSRTAYDTFDGRFFNDPLSGTVRYKYSIDTLGMKDVYEMATYMGKKHAGYLYDFFLNQYIAKHLPPGTDQEEYYHYDPRRKSLTPAGDEYFEILDTR